MCVDLSDLSSDNIKEFCRDALLTQFVVFQPELFKKLAGVVVGALHRHHAGSLLGGSVLSEDFGQCREQI